MLENTGEYVGEEQPSARFAELSQEMLLPNPRQQDRLIYALHTGDTEALFDPKLELDKDKREVMLREIADQLPGPDQFGEILRKFAVPSQTEPDPQYPEGVFGELNAEEKGILAHFARGDIGLSDHVVAADVAWLVGPSHYPDLMQFLSKSDEFLDAIEEDKRAEYKRLMLDFERKVYGAQYSNWEQFQLLFRKQMDDDLRWQPEKMRKVTKLPKGHDTMIQPPDFGLPGHENWFR